MTENTSLKKKSKDSVFIKFFSDKENVLQLYKELHPEDKKVTIDDITIQTLESAMVNTLYNDLGFVVKDMFIVLIEAQSTWNPNITLRLLFYLLESLRRYLHLTNQSELYNVKVKIPPPEFYVIYSGPRKVKKKIISLNEELFDGKAGVDLKATVISDVDGTLSGQYIGFCKVFDEQRKKYDNGIEAAKETYRICIEKGYLVDFMNKHRKEVISMMEELFDEEYMRKQYDKAARADYERIGEERGIAIGEERGIAIGEERGIAIGEERGIAIGEERGIAIGDLKGRVSAALNMLKLGNISNEDISKVTELPIEKILELSMGH